MASVSSVNPGVADLLQTLSSGATGSLSSILSSSAVQTALKNAAPEDVVQLSQAAQQLVEANGLFASAANGLFASAANGLFASPGISQTATDPATLLIQAVNSSLSGSTSSSNTATASGTSQQQLVSELFGTTPATT